MNVRNLPILAIFALLTSTVGQAQKNTAFAITADTKGAYTWNVIREIDLTSGEVIRTVYNPGTQAPIKYAPVAGAEFKGTMATPTGVGVAAAALDAKNNRLYFTQMRSHELLYMDLNDPELKVVINNDKAFNTGNKYYEGNVITRMAFAADGFGYAITNDGKNFIRFTTGQKPEVKNLGELIDDKNNGTLSVHAQCSSWGGDMVGDAYGNLYLVTYRNHLYKINPTTKNTAYLGQIKGLPAEFTSNGMVVSNSGELIVSSATKTNAYFQVNPSTLQATAINNGGEIYNASDLANSNLLYQVKSSNIRDLAFGDVKANLAVSLYPNPSPGRFFNLQFLKVPAGRYTVALTDASGRNVFSRMLRVNNQGQVERVMLPKTAGGGMYLVKVTGGDNRIVYNDKIMVQ